MGRNRVKKEMKGYVENRKEGVSGEIKKTEALDKRLKEKSLNELLTEGRSFDCGNKNGFLGANITLAMRDNTTKEYLQNLIKKNF